MRNDNKKLYAKLKASRDRLEIVSSLLLVDMAKQI